MPAKSDLARIADALERIAVQLETGASIVSLTPPKSDPVKWELNPWPEWIRDVEEPIKAEARRIADRLTWPPSPKAERLTVRKYFTGRLTYIATGRKDGRAPKTTLEESQAALAELNPLEVLQSLTFQDGSAIKRYHEQVVKANEV